MQPTKPHPNELPTPTCVHGIIEGYCADCYRRREAAFDWTIIAAMREEERQKALRLSSEAVKAARAKILADLKGSRDDR